MMRNYMLDGMMGLVVGDALGVPVEFVPRNKLEENPIRKMIGYGSHNVPAGSWSDDSSLALATLDSLRTGKIDLEDIMDRFSMWINYGEYTPEGFAFDIGRTTRSAIDAWDHDRNPYTCGRAEEKDNGNGSLMRILPVCIFCIEKGFSDEYAVAVISEIGGLTHNHARSHIACAIYYFLIKAIIENNHNTVLDIVQDGVDNAFGFFDRKEYSYFKKELTNYHRLKDVKCFKGIMAKDIYSSGYVVDCLEAAVWCLLNTETYDECVLKAVNLGGDSDTTAAVAGGLAGLVYGFENIKWKKSVKRAKWIYMMCNY